MGETRFPTWLDVQVTVPADQLDAALTALAGAGFAQSWVDQPLVHDKGPDGWVPRPAQPETCVVHVYVEAGGESPAAALRIALGELAHDIVVQTQATEEWLDDWRQGRRVVELVDGWSIAPPWLADEAPDPAKTVIIDPGLAFGAGDHVTTQDCGRLVVQLTRPGDRVLDLGAGSGVLSILALRLGAREAIAVEIDALAAGEIERNGALNGVTGLQAILADATTQDFGGTFDLLAANLGAGELRRLAGVCWELCGPGSRLILSGLVDWAAEDVIAAYLAVGFELIARLTGDHEWVTAALRRN